MFYYLPHKHENLLNSPRISSETKYFILLFQAPTIHPIDQVLEGSDMKVLCIAMGTPTPHVTVYLNGHPLRTDVTRHMVTNILNVTRDMEHVSCYADNGYGTPMIASRKIMISRAPSVRSVKTDSGHQGPALTGTVDNT